MTPFQNILKLQHDCASICQELLSCLDNEKKNLIEFRVDEVMQSNAVKERLSQRLSEAKEKLNHALVLYYNIESPNALSQFLETDEEIQAWTESRSQWEVLWEQTRSSLETNLMFIKHSLKNLSLLGDNLKRLLGARPVYTNQGKKVENQIEGKVVQGAV